jgi:putative DNA primase/helicase
MILLGLFEPEPWPEEVDGDDLLDRLVAAILQYIVMLLHEAETVALWVVHAHGFELWRHTPRLAAVAPEKGCGKTTLLDVLKPLVPRALQTENISPAALFRAVQQLNPTLLIDEFDTFGTGNNELRNILNAGHKRGGCVYRCEGDNHDLKAFTTFAPAALAGIGRLPETLSDRSIRIPLQKRKPGEPVQDFRDDRADHLHEMARQAARWVKDNEAQLRRTEPAMPLGIHNRQADNWRALLAIADTAGGDWPKRARQACVALSRDSGDTASIRVQLLADIHSAFNETGHGRLFSEEIVDRLHGLEDRPWPEYGRQRKPISKTQVANLLNPFSVTPSTVRRGDRTDKGYKLEDFTDLFERYLCAEKGTHAQHPPFQTVTPSQAKDTAGFRPNHTVTLESGVTAQNPPNAKETAVCDGVTVDNGGTGELGISEAEYEREERLAIQTEPPLSPETREANRFLGPEPIPPMFDRRPGASKKK